MGDLVFRIQALCHLQMRHGIGCTSQFEKRLRHAYACFQKFGVIADRPFKVGNCCPRLPLFPVNLAKPVVTQLASAGHVTRGWLGVGIQPLTADLAKSFRLTRTDGALVTSVSEGSPAAKAGLKEGDVIVEYDGRPVARAGDLPRAVAETPVGRAVPLKVVRDGKPVTLTATVAQLEETREAKAESAPDEPALGVSARTLTPAVAQQLGLREQQGVLIVNVNDGSRAEAAGLKAGDVIAEVDHRAVSNVEDLQQALRRHATGAPVLLLVHREDAHVWIAVGA